MAICVHVLRSWYEVATMTDTQHQIQTFSPINYDNHQEWSIDEFLAKGGEIKQVVIKPAPLSKDALFRRDVRLKLANFLESRGYSSKEFAVLAKTAESNVSKILGRFDTPSMTIFKRIDSAIDRLAEECSGVNTCTS